MSADPQNPLPPIISFPPTEQLYQYGMMVSKALKAGEEPPPWPFKDPESRPSPPPDRVRPVPSSRDGDDEYNRLSLMLRQEWARITMLRKELEQMQKELEASEGREGVNQMERMRHARVELQLMADLRHMTEERDKWKETALKAGGRLAKELGEDHRELEQIRAENRNLQQKLEGLREKKA